MLVQKILVGKGGPIVYTSRAGAIPLDKIASLCHESLDDAVKGRVQIATLLEPLGSCLALHQVVDKILDGFGNVLLIEDQTKVQNLVAHANLEKGVLRHVDIVVATVLYLW